MIVLTHGHPDHSDGARRLAELTGAPVLAVDPAHRLGPDGLGPGDTRPGGRLRAAGDRDARALGRLGVPAARADGAVLTGDTVLGRGTTVIGSDGSLSDYLGSLDRLRALTDEQNLAALLPGHGPLLG